MFTDEEMLQSYIDVKFSLVRRDWQPDEMHHYRRTYQIHYTFKKHFMDFQQAFTP